MTADQIRHKYGIPKGVPLSTPWGQTNYGAVVCDGVAIVSTPSHGGYKVKAKQNRRIPLCFRHASGWYEEDCDADIVHVFIPETVGGDLHRIERAKKSLKNWHWRAYEECFGAIPRGESHTKDKYLFEKENVDNWVVITAFGSGWGGYAPVPDGFVGVVATKGGNREGLKKYFLIPAEEYGGDERRFGFVVDPEKHREWA